MIILWQFEECENSQPVRAKLTEMAIDFIAVNAPAGHREKDLVMEKLFGSNKTPAIWNTQTGDLIQGREECIDYVIHTLAYSNQFTGHA